MSMSRRNFVRTAGLGSLGMWAAPRLRLQATEDALHAFGRTELADAGPIILCFNENPVGPGQPVLDALQKAFGQVSRYPFGPTAQFRQALARHLKLPGADSPDLWAVFGAHHPTSLMVGVGSSEILRSCSQAFTGPDRALVTASPSYGVAVTEAKAAHAPVREVPVDANLGLDLDAMLDQARGAGMIYICNPNNPTATVHDASDLEDFIKQVNARAPECIIVVDEAYIDYTDDPDRITVLPVALGNPSVVVMRTFSKAYGMASLRLGYGVGHPDTIDRIASHKLTLGDNFMAVTAGLATLENASQHIANERQRNREAREFTQNAFAEMGFRTGPSSANFIFVPIRRDASEFETACKRQNVLVGRTFKPLTTYSRISIGTIDQMHRAVEVFRSVLATA